MATHRGSWGGGVRRTPPGDWVASQEPSGHPLPRGVAGGAREAKKCTFCWVFNNSPSRDRIRHFFAHFWPFLAPPKQYHSVRLEASKPQKSRKSGFPKMHEICKNYTIFRGRQNRPKSGIFGHFRPPPGKPPFLALFGGCPGGGIGGLYSGYPGRSPGG